MEIYCLDGRDALPGRKHAHQTSCVLIISLKSDENTYSKFHHVFILSLHVPNDLKFKLYESNSFQLFKPNDFY